MFLYRRLFYFHLGFFQFNILRILNNFSWLVSYWVWTLYLVLHKQDMPPNSVGTWSTVNAWFRVWEIPLGLWCCYWFWYVYKLSNCILLLYLFSRFVFCYVIQDMLFCLIAITGVVKCALKLVSKALCRLNALPC